MAACRAGPTGSAYRAGFVPYTLDHSALGARSPISIAVEGPDGRVVTGTGWGFGM